MESYFKKTIPLLCAVVLSCQATDTGQSDLQTGFPNSVTVTLENPFAEARSDEAVVLAIADILDKAPDFNPEAFLVLHGSEEIPSQADDLNGDGRADQIALVTDFQANETKDLTLRYASDGTIARDYPKRTQAELSQKFGGHFENQKYIGGAFRNVQFVRVPSEHTDHSEFFRYEGPGWESDKIGYRFYLDWRNAIDIFGKNTTDMVLQDVGQDGFDSYREMAEWGMGILKVGESLGIGSIGMWYENKAMRVSETDSVTCEIVANGPVYSQIRTQYFGWQIGDAKHDLTSNLSIAAGSRLTRHHLSVTGHPDNLCTGIAKHENTEVLQPAANSREWTYFATYGLQSLAGDSLGLAIIFRTSDLVQITEDALNHVVVLRPSSGELSYYFLGVWEKEPNGIASRQALEEYLQRTVAELNAPMRVSL